MSSGSNEFKYLVFTGHDYYPKGGIKDYKGCRETLEEARESARGEMGKWSKFLRASGEWYQIVDRGTMETVEEGKLEAG